MTVTQRAALSAADQSRLAEARRDYDDAMRTIDTYRAVAVEMVEKSSYREVARLTGLSTNTLQRWKREAGK
jgi:DNA invertase Pin-like site-specific DNA recombinase